MGGQYTGHCHLPATLLSQNVQVLLGLLGLSLLVLLHIAAPAVDTCLLVLCRVNSRLESKRKGQYRDRGGYVRQHRFSHSDRKMSRYRRRRRCGGTRGSHFGCALCAGRSGHSGRAACSGARTGSCCIWSGYAPWVGLLGITHLPTPSPPPVSVCASGSLLPSALAPHARSR